MRLLAYASPQKEGDLERAIHAIKKDNKYVEVPDYDMFPAQGWDPLFRDAGIKPEDKRGEDSGIEERERSKMCIKKLESLLSPPAAFFQGHLAGELPSIVDAIGCTPLVRLSRIAAAAGCACQLLGKCEYLSAGGSVKDRIARGMITTAEADGLLADGAAIIEPTSGNTGIGLALVAAVKGYRSVAVMPMKMSAEKHSIMNALGATILRTPTKAAWNDQDSHIALSIRLQNEMNAQNKVKKEAYAKCDGVGTKADARQPACILDQYRNVANPASHFFGTGAELLHQCGTKLDMVVICAGTGGTLTGIGKRIKLALPECLVVGVDPVGSILADPTETPGKPYLVEGIGYDFVPTVLDRDVTDFWIKVTDAEGLLCSRLLLKLEGMLVGGSAGSALAGTFKAIERMGWSDDPTKRIALILPDGSRNYTSKFVSDEWMADKGFLEPMALHRQYPEYKSLTIQSLELPRLRFVSAHIPLVEAAAQLMKSPQRFLVVVDTTAAQAEAEKDGVPLAHLLGTVSQKGLLMALGDMPNDTTIETIAETDTPVYNKATPLSRVAQSLELRSFILVESDGVVNAAVGADQLLQAFIAKK
ncbi:cystathionine beta-synthase [Cyclospora cayetanensis]|nr:cystathionine beta-synthase [Cyclospora cayetanensis]